jgi:glucokinase
VAVVLALDVGGTTIKAEIVDRSGRVVRTDTRPTPAAAGADAVVEAVRAAVRASCDGADAIGIVVPGAVDVAAGVARYAANLGWRDVPLRDLLEADTGLQVILEHDVRAAGLAERAVGAAAGSRDCLVVVIGTGIAGVVVSGGVPLTGATHLAGEIGHVPVWPDGELCACGQRGCLETYASGGAIARRYTALSGRPASAEQVIERRQQDEVASLVWREAVEALGIALTTATMLLDPELIVLSGGLAEAGSVLLDPVRDALASRLTWRPPPRVELSPLASRAGRIGAALLAWRSLEDSAVAADDQRADQPDQRRTSTATSGPEGGAVR